MATVYSPEAAVKMLILVLSTPLVFGFITYFLANLAVIRHR